MKVTTFYWQNKPFDMVLIKSIPHPSDVVGQSVFAFDVFDLLLAIDSISPLEVQLCTSGGMLTRKATEIIFTTFSQDDLVTQSDIVLVRPYVTFFGLGKLGEILPQVDQSEWILMLNQIRLVMVHGYCYIKQAIAQKMHQVGMPNSEEENFPKIPVRVQVLGIQRNMVRQGLTSTARVDFPFPFNKKDEYMSERTLVSAIAKLSGVKYTIKTVRDKLVELGFLVVSSRSKYCLSRLGEGYALEMDHERYWHLSILKLLGNL